MDLLATSLVGVVVDKDQLLILCVDKRGLELRRPQILKDGLRVRDGGVLGQRGHAFALSFTVGVVLRVTRVRNLTLFEPGLLDKESIWCLQRKKVVNREKFVLMD